jgi:uncharacterized protein
MKKLPLIFLTLLLIPLALAVTYTPINYVSDYANVLTPQEEAQLNALAAQIEQNTTVEIAILTIPSLDNQDINQFAVEIFEQWGIGKKDIDNGLLILIAPNDHQYRLEVGYGLEPIITDATAGRIGRARFTENFQQENYAQGLQEALQDISGFIQNEPEVISQYTQPKQKIPARLLLWPFIIVGLIIANITDKKPKKTKLITRIATGILFFLIIAYFDYIVAFTFLFFFAVFVMPHRKGRGGAGLILLGGLGGSGGGGFGGFGGGLSGGGGAGGRW